MSNSLPARSSAVRTGAISSATRASSSSPAIRIGTGNLTTTPTATAAIRIGGSRRTATPRTGITAARANTTATKATAAGANTTTSPPSVVLTEEEVLCKGLECVHFEKNRQQRVQRSRNIERFRCNYGVSPLAISKVIIDLQTLLDEVHRIKKFDIHYLFLTLFWFRSYLKYPQIEGPWKVCPQTIGEKIIIYAEAIQRLKKHKVKWFEDGDYDDEEIFLVSVDGIHCRTFEVRKDPGKKWYSHKSHGAGLAYELAIAIRSDRLVWMNGPFYASKSDITIFRYGDGDENNPGPNLRDMLPEGKRAVADSGYRGEDGKKCSITRQGDSDEVKEFKARAKSRQEVFNSKVKAFVCTATEFRHGKEIHATAFESVCILLQYDMENGYGLLFEI
jgi:hypothetical protein